MSIRFASLAAIGLLAAGCHVGADAEDREDGAEVTRSYQVGSFDRLKVAGVASHHTGAELRFEDPWRNRIRVAVR